MMKSPFFFFLFLFSLQECEAQKAVVANLKMNVAYVGVANPLDILVEGYNWDDLNVTVSNGRIEKNKKERLYDYFPKRQGKDYIVVASNKKPFKVIAKIEFRVKLIPDVYPYIAGVDRKKIQKDKLLHSDSIEVMIRGFDWDHGFIIQNYSIIILRKDSVLFIKNDFQGSLFPNALKKEFKKTKDGDKILLYNVAYMTPSRDTIELVGANFTIIEK